MLSQYESQIVHGNYFIDDREHLIKYTRNLKIADEDPEETSVLILDQILDENLEDAGRADLNERTEACLFRLLGAALASIKKNIQRVNIISNH